jgi:hypothetical protein
MPKMPASQRGMQRVEDLIGFDYTAGNQQGLGAI